jgi:hypothetical protein
MSTPAKKKTKKPNGPLDVEAQLVILKKKKFQIFNRQNLVVSSNYYLMCLDSLFLNSFFTRRFDRRKVNEPYQDSIFSKIQRVTEMSTSTSTLENFLEKESIGYHSMSMSSAASSVTTSDLSTISEASVEPGQRKVLKPKKQRTHSALRRKSLLLRVLDFNFLLVL